MMMLWKKMRVLISNSTFAGSIPNRMFDASLAVLCGRDCIRFSICLKDANSKK